MIKRALFVLLGFAVGIAEAQTDEPNGSKARGRVVEGQIVAAGSKPVEGAKVLFCQDGFVDGATSTTDAQVRYRADLVKLPWSTEAIRALVLAPGFKPADRKIEPGTGTATVNFELVAEPWHEIQVRLEDSSGRPVAGEEISCSVGDLIFPRYKTDALGNCRIEICATSGWRCRPDPRMPARSRHISMEGRTIRPRSRSRFCRQSEAV